jgi:Holliday junction resolvase
MRRAAKRDLVEPEIVQALERAGWVVDRISGEDLPDLLLSRRGFLCVAEVKTGKAKLRPGQQKFRDRFQGPFVELRTVQDALNLSRVAVGLPAYQREGVTPLRD